MRVGQRSWWIRGILTSLAVNVVKLLSLRVIRLQILVGNWPRRRDPAAVADLTEVFLAQPKKGSTEKLGITPTL